MRAARRQHRATPQSLQAASRRGIAAALAALHCDQPIAPEQAVALERKLAAVPYCKPPQGELALEPHACV